MLFRQRFLELIKAGKVTRAYRRWQRPTVKAGGTLLTAVGQLAILSVEACDEATLKEADARAAGYATLAELKTELAQRPGRLCCIRFKLKGADPRIALREKSTLSAEESTQLNARLARLDKPRPWTLKVLRAIEQHPLKRAADLAKVVGAEKDWLKVHIRKLKNLGLTESLEVGYRLSPRGRAYLKVAAA